MPIDYDKLVQQTKSRVQTSVPPQKNTEPSLDSPFAMNQAISTADAKLNERSFLGKAADTISKGFDKFKETPAMRQLRLVTGAAVGTAGAIAGATVGTVLTPTERLLSLGKNVKEKGLGEGFKQTIEETPEALKKNIIDTAADTAKFGYEIGDEGAAQAPLAAGGKLVNAAQAYSQGYHGVEDIQKGEYLKGGIELGSALLSGKQAIKGKGLLIDKGFLDTVKTSKGSTPKPDELLAAHDAETLTPAQKKQLDKAESVYSEVLNLGKRQLRNQQTAALSGRAEKNVPRLLAQEGIALKRTPDGKLDTTEAIQTLRERMDKVDDHLTAALEKDPTPWLDYDSLMEKTKTQIQSGPGTASQKKAMLADIQSIVGDEKEALGVTTGGDIALANGSQAATFKKGLYSMADYDQTKTPDSQKAIKLLAKNVKEEIESHYGDENIKGINDVIGSYSEMIKALKSIHGGVVRGGMLGRRLNQLGGLAIGMMGAGPAGGIAGAEVAGRLTDYALDPARRTSSAAKALEGVGVSGLSSQILPKE